MRAGAGEQGLFAPGQRGDVDRALGKAPGEQAGGQGEEPQHADRYVHQQMQRLRANASQQGGRVRAGWHDFAEAHWQSAAMSPFPKPRDREAARRLREAFPQTPSETTGDGSVGAVLDCLGGNSPYLAELALRGPDTLLAIGAEGPDAVCDRALSRLGAVGPAESRATVASEMRAAKRTVALAAAIADIGGAWTLDQVTGTLSDLAGRRLEADHSAPASVCSRSRRSAAAASFRTRTRQWVRCSGDGQAGGARAEFFQRMWTSFSSTILRRLPIPRRVSAPPLRDLRAILSV